MERELFIELLKKHGLKSEELKRYDFFKISIEKKFSNIRKELKTKHPEEVIFFEELVKNKPTLIKLLEN